MERRWGSKRSISFMVDEKALKEIDRQEKWFIAVGLGNSDSLADAI